MLYLLQRQAKQNHWLKPFRIFVWKYKPGKRRRTGAAVEFRSSKHNLTFLGKKFGNSVCGTYWSIAYTNRNRPYFGRRNTPKKFGVKNLKASGLFRRAYSDQQIFRLLQIPISKFSGCCIFATIRKCATTCKLQFCRTRSWRAFLQ